MAEQTENYSMTIAPGVVDRVIAIAAQEVDGVARVSSYNAGGLGYRLLSRAKQEKIETEVGENGKLNCTIYLSTWYGKSIPEVAQAVRENVAAALKLQTGIEVGQVNVHVEGVEFKKTA